jgi:hypothetical protein
MTCDLPIGGQVMFRHDDDFTEQVYWVNGTNRPSDHRHDMWVRRGDLVTRVRTCTSMSQWMTCSATESISGERRSAFAYDDYTAETVMAWNPLANNTARVTVGHVSYASFPMPWNSGLVSRAKPGLACSAYNAGGYDCVLAAADATGRIRTRRFWSSAGSTHYNVNAESGTHLVGGSNVRTADDVVVWRQDGLWLLAYRDIWGTIRTFRSTNGATWEFDAVVAQGTVGGPSVAEFQPGAFRLYWTAW